MKIIGANITGSFILNNQDVTNTLQSSSVWSGSVAAEINSLNAASASLNSATASLSSATASLYAATASLNSATASLNTFTASAATTGSNTFNGNQIVSGSLTVTGSITTPGTLTAQTLVVQTITSSQDFVTGSTKFGSIISNTHQFTGSISVSGSVAVNDSNVILTNQTSSMSVASASFASTASFVQNAVSTSYAITASILKNPSATVSSSTGIYTSGSTLLYNLSAFKGAMINYVVSTSGSGANMRAGTFTAAWNATSSVSNESMTMDIGDTTAIQFSADKTGSIFVSASSGTWVIDSLYRGIGVGYPTGSAPSPTPTPTPTPTQTPTPTPTPSAPASYTVGQAALGGIIAYILQPGDPGYEPGVQHGLVVTTNNLPGDASWGCFPTSISGADGEAIGTGLQNSIDIVNGCSESNIAAKKCLDLVQGGYSDWYLPSKDELNKLYLNKDTIGGTWGGYFWSSTEISAPYAWTQNFNNGSQDQALKGDTQNVRAIRSF